MTEVSPLASVKALFDRARGHIPRAELPHLVMNDPGHAGYVTAYERVLARGVSALVEDAGGGLPLMGSFDITENLLLSHATAGESVTHRWFSVLTAFIELLGASTYCYAPLSRTLAALLVDSFALDAGGVHRAPVDLLPLVCRELRERSWNVHDRALALVGELLTTTLTDEETKAMCLELHARHDEFQQWYQEDGERNWWYAERPEFIWGAVAKRADLPTWLELVDRHFPSSPELAERTRERLLREGNAWLHSSRRD
jgi:hypothetical protein